MEIKADSTALFSINRNILECKDEQNHGAGRCGACINRNILECKVLSMVPLFLASLCINRNILECKVILDRKEKFQEWEY